MLNIKKHLIFIIGIFFLQIHCFGKNLDKPTDEALVIVEPVPIQTAAQNSVYKLIEYNKRKSDWSSIFSLGYGQLSLPNFETNFLVETFPQVYGDNISYTELQYGKSKNFSLLALGFETGVGFLTADAMDGLSDKPSIQLLPIKLGLRVSFNSLFSEPYILPYFSGGAYAMLYKEELNSSTSEGNASLAAYYSAGLAFQLNWIDPKASRVSFINYGIQNTFIYIEVKQFMTSSQKQDPDFASDPSLSAGFLLEL